MQFINGGSIQYTYENEDVHIIGKRITLDDVKAIGMGQGAYIAVIPTCKKDDKMYHILCDTFWQKDKHCGSVVADFGSGVKKYETPYSVMYNGITKKMPLWKGVIAFQIETDATEIYSIEYMHAVKNDVRYAIIVKVDITPFLSLLDELLVLTKEITDLKAYEEVDRSILSLPNISYGLMYYRDYITYEQKYD